MSTRQAIGRRAPQRKTRKPGRERRRALVQAAYDLLCEKPLDDVSFKEIAARADVPEGSAYHFFANRFDLFAMLAADLSERFVAAHEKPVPAACRRDWNKLAGHFVKVGARVYADNPPARQLLIGGTTPPQVKQADRGNDRVIADVMFNISSRYFDIPDSDAIRNAFYYFIEITDLMFMLSVIEHGEITPAMFDEAKRAGLAYLSTHVGDPAPRVE